MRRAALVAALVATPASAAHPVGQPPFAFTCKLGPKVATVATEGAALVYRYGPPGKPELVIRGSAAAGNLFFRHQPLGPRGEAQQLRFTNGGFAYVLSSVFVAGPGEPDEVRLFVLQGAKVLKSRPCAGAASFENYDQLEALPRDTLPLLDW